MEIPKSVKVGGITYKVVEDEGLEKEGNLGEILYHEGLIKLHPEMQQDRKEQVFVHELLHGIFREAGFSNQEEETINRVAIVLHQVLKDNDFLAKDKKIVLSGSVNCSECGADWSRGEICPHIYGPLEAVNMNNTDIVSFSPFVTELVSEGLHFNPSPLEGLIAKDPTNWGKSISQIMDEGGLARCPACTKTWKRGEKPCSCPVSAELVEIVKIHTIESEGTK